MWQLFIDSIEQGLIFLSQAIAGLGIPYSFGFAIILFTLIVKGLTYPLTAQQLKTSKVQRELQPKLKVLQEKHKGDREGLAQAQMALYKEHGINPMGGCLPMLIQMPIWMGLYRALYALAKMPNSPLKAGFLWIPSLAGPIDILSDHPRSIDWLLPNSNHFLGWGQAMAYVILPVLLVVSQFYTQKILSPPTDNSNKNPMGQVTKFMPLMFGYFSLVVPSALTLYWITSNTLSLIQQRLMLRKPQTARLSENEMLKGGNPSTSVQLTTNSEPTAIDDASPSQKPSRNRRRSKSKKRKRKK